MLDQPYLHQVLISHSVEMLWQHLHNLPKLSRHSPRKTILLTEKETYPKGYNHAFHGLNSVTHKALLGVIQSITEHKTYVYIFIYANSKQAFLINGSYKSSSPSNTATIFFGSVLEVLKGEMFADGSMKVMVDKLFLQKSQFIQDILCMTEAPGAT